MPTYEYECTKCKHNFEAFQQMTAKALEECPKCGGKVKKLISSGAGIIFKGSGFYATDYRKKPKHHKPEKMDACPQAKEGCNACHQHF
jgi:putative FmdB family regulatory protein